MQNRPKGILQVDKCHGLRKSILFSIADNRVDTEDMFHDTIYAMKEAFLDGGVNDLI